MPKFRASSLADIMTDPKSIDESLLNEDLLKIKNKKVKTDDEKKLLEPYFLKTLSEGAITKVTQMAKEFIYGYDQTISSKYMDKGIEVEDRSIELLNSVLFTNYAKNTERKTNDWITGECDVVGSDRIHDIKSSWSLQTFPVLAKLGEDKTYEWQGRAYMMLWDMDKFEIDYCLVNTPDHLIGYEDVSLHSVEHIAPELRVTRVFYERDKALEDKIKIKVEAAQALYVQMIERIGNEHKF
jgi:hypothetical protein